MQFSKEKALEQKKIQIEELLKEWANHTGFLIPGEQIVFTLQIQRIPTVVEGVNKNILDMTTDEFFIRERLEAAGVEVKINLSRLRSAFVDHYHESATVRSLLTDKYVVRALHEPTNCRIKNVGKKVITNLKLLLEYHDIKY